MIQLTPTRLRPHPVAAYEKVGPFRPGPAPGSIRRFPTSGPHCIRWIEANCVFTARRWARKPFVLEPWQKQLILDLFEINPRTNRRRYRYALIGMGRKNGKTELMAAIALYLLLAVRDVDGDIPCIVVAATSDKQANLIFSAAARMALYSPTLGELVDVFGDQIQIKDQPEARIVRVSAKARSAHGLNISVCIFDELHEWPAGSGDELWEVLTTGMSAGEEPLVLQITTAGFDLDGTICGQQYQHGRKVESGEIRDPAYFFRWWAAPDGADTRSAEAHMAANPGYGTIKPRRWFLDQVVRIRESMFRRLELNQWTPSENTWLPQGTWENCYLDPTPDPIADAIFAAYAIREALGDDAVELARERAIIRRAVAAGLRFDLPLYLGWDAASKNDSTALVAVQQQDDRIVVCPWIWERGYDSARARPTPNYILPLDEVAETIEVLWRRFKLAAVPFDPAMIWSEAARLGRLGVPMLEIPQGGARMQEASQALYEVVVRATIAHDGDAALSRHIHNAVARQARRGSAAWRLEKGEAVRKMDAAIALAMAVWAMQHPAEEIEPKRVVVKVYGDEAEDEEGDYVEAF